MLDKAVSREIHEGKKNPLIHCLVTNIIENIFFCVHQKKEIHTGLKQLVEIFILK